MTIEELFGTLQQSVVATWRRHLRTAKYSKHMALNDFYEEMPEKVDALIEAWMGVNGKKIKGYDNVLQSKNMNTLTYLKELRKVVKQGYALMNGEAELEAKLDDIVELIDSTLYKVKELSENKVMDLKDFINEALVNESNLLTAASKKHWVKMLGFNPAAIDYKKTRARNNFEKFANAEKLSELFDYLVSGMSRKHEYTQSQWINIIADMDIDDYETHNGPLQTYNGIPVVRESVVNEAQSFLDGCESYPSNWDLIDIFDETDGGKPAKLKNVDWLYYFDDEDFVERNESKIIKQFTDFFAACNSIRNVDCGNMQEGGFNDEMFREEIGEIDSDECGVALHKDGDDGTWTIITFTKEIDSLPKPQQTALLNLMSKYENSGWYYVEYFDAI